MTENEIYKMEAGRELDALVAEKVMGFTASEVAETLDAWKVGVQISKPLGYYSTDISAAWEVVQKMKTLNFDFSIYSTDDSGEASFFKTENNKRSAECDGKNVQEAICKCALLVVLDLA